MRCVRLASVLRASVIEWQVAGEKVRGSLSIELDEVVAAGSIIEREYALVGTSGSLTLSLEWR